MSKLIKFMIKHRVKNPKDLFELFNNETHQELMELMEVEYTAPPIESDIVSIVSEVYKMSAEELCSATRIRKVVDARATASFLIFASTNYTLQRIGDSFFKQDHATVIHSVKKAINLCQTDISFKQKMNECLVIMGEFGYNCNTLKTLLNDTKRIRRGAGINQFKNLCYRRDDFFVDTKDNENELSTTDCGTSSGVFFGATSTVVI